MFICLFGHHGRRHFHGFSWLDATFLAGAQRREDQRDRVAGHNGGLHCAVTGCRAWDELGANYGQRAITQGEEGARVVRAQLSSHTRLAHTRKRTLFTTSQASPMSSSSPHAALI